MARFVGKPTIRKGSPANLCYHKSRKKTNKKKLICQALARQNCLKENGSVKKTKNCRRNYAGMMKWSTNSTIYRRNPKGDRRTR